MDEGTPPPKEVHLKIYLGTTRRCGIFRDTFNFVPRFFVVHRLLCHIFPCKWTDRWADGWIDGQMGTVTKVLRYLLFS